MVSHSFTRCLILSLGTEREIQLKIKCAVDVALSELDVDGKTK